jgi:methylenetetrahydrofolate--tRNA-(uracil-5-)-methyltransferase
LLLDCAEQTRIPAGGALAVDREAFSALVTRTIENHPRIHVVREEARLIPDGATVIASGPLTSAALSEKLVELLGREHLYFYDAIAPVVIAETIDMSIAFRASRYQRGEQVEGDYINCPLARDEYETFVSALVGAERIQLKYFETEIESGVRAGPGRFFEGCLPVEVLAQRGPGTLAFGPLRPVGLVDPRSGQRPYAIVQLRQDNLVGTLYNLVGFQTNLTYPEQRRVFRLIPGLEKAEFARYGQMHRNTFIYSPSYIQSTLQYRQRANLFFAGQITGVEGYAGNIATGLLAGWNAARFLYGDGLIELPVDTMLGALCYYVSHASPDDFQPMKANYGLLPPLDQHVRGSKRERGLVYSQRATESLEYFLRAFE